MRVTSAIMYSGVC